MKQEPSPRVSVRRRALSSHVIASESAGIHARRIALEILVRVDIEGAFADVLLGSRLAELDNSADRRLVTQLVLGTITWRGWLDYELARLSSRPLKAIDPPILNLLRMGLYQLRRLTRVPAHAALDTAVRLAREISGNAGVSGFVNAVLRAATRAAPSLPDRSLDEIDYLSVYYSHPRWLVEKFRSWFGVDQAEAIMAANNQAAPNVIRLNLSQGQEQDLVERIERDGMKVARCGVFPETIVLEGAPLFDSSSYRDGIFAMQSEASQVIARMLAPSRGMTVLDCAAAPGGKSAHLAELVGRMGRVIALDRKIGGLRQARAVVTRLGHRNIEFIRCDLTTFLPFSPRSFKYVLLDAPCTGLGTLREHPEIRWRLSPDDLTRLSRLQERMLNKVAGLVAPEGTLVYSVCSPAPEEGLQLIQRFLCDYPHFRLEQVGYAREGRAVPAISLDKQVSEAGFFAARLRRR